MTDRFDAIVVGAGPAGCAAAYSLAKSGLQVMLVERGRTPGEKNVSGGILFGQALHDLIPNFWEQAPLERRITSRCLTFLLGKSSVTVDHTRTTSKTAPHDGFSVNRYKFDQWFAKQAEEAGAMLAPGIRVDGLLWKDNKIAGVCAGGDEVFSDVVIAADGVNSLLAKEAKLRKDHNPHEMGLGIKEVINLPREVIEERFNLSGEEGAAYSFIGCTKGFPGGGFLYTNLDSLSLGVVVHLSAFSKAAVKAPDLIEHFKSYPSVSRFLRDGDLLEYSAHLVPEGGYGAVTKLYTDGLLVTGDAAGLTLNVGYALEGMNFAIASGVAAAQTVERAKVIGDFSKHSLKRYEQILKDSFVLKDLKTFQHAPAFLGSPRLHNTYPALVNNLVTALFSSRGVPRPKLLTLLIKMVLGEASIPGLLIDAVKLVRGL